MEGQTVRFTIFRKRLLAAIIDYIIIFAIAYTICALIMTSVFKSTFDQQAAPFMALILLLAPFSQIPRVFSAPGEMLTTMMFVLIAIIFVAEVLYYSLFEILPTKRTPGYKLFGIRLTYDSEKSIQKRIVVRNILKVLSRYLYCIPFIISISSANGKTPYDLVSKINVGTDNT